MTTTVLGKTRFDIKGQWSALSTYSVDDLVLYKNGWYRVKANPSVGTLPSDTTKFEPFYQTFNYVGNHVNTTGTTYKINDVVTYRYTATTKANDITTYPTRTVVQTYICIADHTADETNTTLPINTTYWQLITSGSNDAPTDITVGTNTVSEKLGVYGNDHQKCVRFANEGIINDTHPQYALGYKNVLDSRHNLFWIDGAGGVKSLGHNSNASTGAGDTFIGPAPSPLAFMFHDWYASTDNGGTGVLVTPDGKEPRCIQIEFGIDHGTALFNNGEVYAWGYNGNYECGDRSTTNRWIPVRVGGSYGESATQSGAHVLRDVKIVRISQACGNGAANNDSVAAHTLALDSTGAVWAWGYNGYGQCGTGNTTNQQVPYKIPAGQFNNSPVVAIWAAGQNYGVSYAYTAEGKLYAWGYNAQGQLGVNTGTTNQSLPYLVPITFDGAVGTLVKLQCTQNQNYGAAGFLTSTGRVYMTGYNGNGALANGTTTNLAVFTQVGTGPGSGTSATCANFWMLGNASYGVTMFRSTNTAGDTFVVGYNGQYNLGDGTTTNRSVCVNALKRVAGVSSNLTKVVKAVATGGNQYNSYMVLCEDGRMYAVGYNGDGQLGFGYQDSYNGTLTAVGNGIEYENGRSEWLPVMTPTVMTGKNEFGELMVNGIMAYGGTDTATTRYSNFAFRNKYGRMMVQGQGGSASGMLGHLPAGWGGMGNYNSSTMEDVIQNG